ncbi:MAG TPA: protein kinase [Vicinamibacterales bacterium]|nr:protein kinase [Vicinamibacterales bacterium]
MTLAPGERLGPYEIESVLGAGGFGRVYRARDPRLARSVAIKVLSDEAAVVLSSGGFTEEARAAAALSHPHICTVYEVERDNGVDYIVMELLEGHPLSGLISGSALPVSTAVRYGVQIADALAHAHARGVFHGDVKPSNVMVGPHGQSKIVDFGLARRVRAAGDALTTFAATSAGAAATGTPAYMAPEVLRGGSVDARSDIWSLGVLLHEMIAGALPFPGRTVPEMLSAILRDAPRALPSDTPAGLGAIVRRCLAKEPEDRYQTAGEVRSALETIATGEAEHTDRAPGSSRRRFGAIGVIGVIIAIAAGLTAFLLVGRRHDTAQGPTSLAVLPCRTLAERDRLEYLEVGIADSIIIALSNLAQLRVRGTSTILPYQGQDVDLREVGESLRVDYLLTCILQPTPDRLTATVQFVRVADRSTAWGDRYEVRRDNLAGLQDQVAERVASALQIRLTADERARLYRRYTDNASAHEAYLQGRAVLPRYTRAATLAAMDHFKRALGLDPTYALAHAGLASAAARMRIRFSTVDDRASWLDMAKREADEALRLDPDLAEAHESRAAVAREGEFDWGLTMDESARALALNPSLAQPHFFRAGVFYHMGLMERAEREIGLGQANDPLDRVQALRLRGTTALLDGRYAEAATLMDETQHISEVESTGAYTGLVRYYIGQRAEAESLLETLGAQPRAQAALASFLAARGDRKRASALIRELETAADLDHHVAYSLGAAHAQLGDSEEAFKWLERAGATGFPCVPWFERDPLLASLRNDARYRKLIEDLERRVEEFRKRYDRT